MKPDRTIVHDEDCREDLIRRAMRHRGLTRQEAEALVDEYEKDRAGDLEPELVKKVTNHKR